MALASHRRSISSPSRGEKQYRSHGAKLATSRRHLRELPIADDTILSKKTNTATWTIPPADCHEAR